MKYDRKDPAKAIGSKFEREKKPFRVMLRKIDSPGISGLKKIIAKLAIPSTHFDFVKRIIATVTNAAKPIPCIASSVPL